MAFIDNFLNKITMYRLVLYYLTALLGVTALFGLFGIIAYNPANLAFSTLVILAAGWLAQTVFVRVFGALPNVESVYITSLLLALLITPVEPTNYAGIGFLIFASVWAMASKFIFAIGKKHIFNPAAFGIALSGLMIGHAASWWVGGTLPLLPFVVIGGLLIVRKIHRFDLVIAFLITAAIAVTLTTPSVDLVSPIMKTVLHSAIFFLGFVMLTEPLTMPPSRWLRVAYGALVGLLFAPNVHLGSLYFTPELGLLVGNIFVYLVSPKGRFTLSLLEKRELAEGTFEFVFKSDRPLTFKAGQYLEWTVPNRFADDRGNRRFFTIASSPTEDVVRLGVKFYKPASTFKRALWALQEHDTISASHVAGDFTLPRDKNAKLAFIAGGIGVTPFRSMAQYLVDTKDARAVTLLYSNKTAAEIAYKEVFDTAATAIGMKIVYALTDEPAPIPGTVSGFIDAALIAREIPDYKERVFYISGPHGMVEAFKGILQGMGVSRWNIKTDYFPGFA